VLEELGEADWTALCGTSSMGKISVSIKEFSSTRSTLEIGRKRET
jgi:hypothetical protein